jgi:hypothetical protein
MKKVTDEPGVRRSLHLRKGGGAGAAQQKSSATGSGSSAVNTQQPTAAQEKAAVESQHAGPGKATRKQTR